MAEQYIGLIIMYLVVGSLSIIPAINWVPQYLRKSERKLDGDEALVLGLFWPLFYLWVALVVLYRGTRGLLRG
jgi:hypothetical protein